MSSAHSWLDGPAVPLAVLAVAFGIEPLEKLVKRAVRFWRGHHRQAWVGDTARDPWAKASETWIAFVTAIVVVVIFTYRRRRASLVDSSRRQAVESLRGSRRNIIHDSEHYGDGKNGNQGLQSVKDPKDAVKQAEEVDADEDGSQGESTPHEKWGDEFEAARYIPLRLTEAERGLLGILESALHVSEYTDDVDVLSIGGMVGASATWGNNSRGQRMIRGLVDFFQYIFGLLCASDFRTGGRLISSGGFKTNASLLRRACEVGRRHKIMNPSKMRDGYGRLMWILMDASQPMIADALGFSCIGEIHTVGSLLAAYGCTRMLDDTRMDAATRPLPLCEASGGSCTDKNISHAAIAESKRRALDDLVYDYATTMDAHIDDGKAGRGEMNEACGEGNRVEHRMPAADVRRIVASVGDFRSYLLLNQAPIQRMIDFLLDNFAYDLGVGDSGEDGRGRTRIDGGGGGDVGGGLRYGATGGMITAPTASLVSLAIRPGVEGACLRHSHSEQFAFVLQTLILWREVTGSMYALWMQAEADMLDAENPYVLTDTGQGLHRLQQCPRVAAMMQGILDQVKEEAGAWVGLSVVHLGDRDVPNALTFIDKYSQLVHILGPLVNVLDRFDELLKPDADPAWRALADAEFGSAEVLKRHVLADFFRHGFDGGGDDGGSCIDGRLTSVWNWCSKIEKKAYFHHFLLAGFVGFNG